MTDSIIIGTHAAVTDAEKRVSLIFFRSESGPEPVLEWLREAQGGSTDRRRRPQGSRVRRADRDAASRALGGGLFELRVSQRSRRIARVMICVQDGELVALHDFIKKTQKTPAADMTLARSRKRQLDRAQ